MTIFLGSVDSLFFILGHFLSNGTEVRRKPASRNALRVFYCPSWHGDLTAIAQAAPGVKFTSTVTCDSPLKRLSAAR